jgi:riboflavin biosynthesis pyrimidine reductase
VKLYARKNSHHGEATVQIDGGTITTVDMYASTLTDQALIYTSPTLSSGSHSLVFKRKGTKNPSSTDYYVVVDRADITP